MQRNGISDVDEEDVRIDKVDKVDASAGCPSRRLSSAPPAFSTPTPPT